MEQAPVHQEIDFLKKAKNSFLLQVDRDTTKTLSRVLINRYQIMELFFALAALTERESTLDRVDLESLVAMRIRELKQLESLLEQTPLKQALQNFDHDVMSLDECSYQKVAPTIDYYYELSLMCHDYFKLLLKICASVNALYKEYIVPKKGHFNFLDKQIWTIISSIKRATDKINTNVLKIKFCDTLRFTDQKRLDGMVTEFKNNNFTSFIHKLSLKSDFFKKDFLNENKTSHDKASHFYYYLLELRNNFQLIADKSDQIIKLHDLSGKMKQNFYTYIFNNYFNAQATAAINNEFFNSIFSTLSGETKLHKVLLYRIHDIKNNSTKEEREEYAYIAHTLIQFSQQYDLIDELYKQLDTYKPNLPSAGKELYLKELLEKIKVLKDIKATTKSMHELQETKNLYAKLLLAHRQTSNTLLNKIDKDYLSKEWKLLRQYGVELSKSHEKALKILGVMPRDTLSACLISTAMQDKITEDFKDIEDTVFMADGILYPYLAEVYEIITDKPYQLFDKQLTMDQKKKFKQFVYSCTEQEHKEKKLEQKKRNNQAQKDLARTQSKEKELEKESKEKVDQPLKLKEYKRRAKQKQRLRHLKWHDFLKEQEKTSNEPISCVSIDHDSAQLVIMRHWRGYNSPEQMTLFLYSHALPNPQNSYLFSINIDKEYLPKMVDKLDNNWDYYHVFSQEVEKRYLSSYALIVQPEDQLAREINLNLSSGEYALCIRAKFMSGSGHYSPEFAIFHKDNGAKGTNGYLVYIIDAVTHKCYHRFFHTLNS